NCWDQCALRVFVEKGKVVSIGPDERQSVTGRFLCTKGRRHIERLYHPERLRYPLQKVKGSFRRVSWSQALQIAAERFSAALERHGPLSLLHYYDGGYGGLLKNIEKRFFSALGGCTTHRGSLCWGAGMAAQGYDFGAVKAHSYEDLRNARLIIIWGRNPAATAVHLLPQMRLARENGTKVILIDPIETATASYADEHISVKPGSDGALALAMANLIIKKGLSNDHFVQNYCSGFDQFKALAVQFPPERAAALTGLPTGEIERLADFYAAAKPASILIGYGLQRHSNGGNTVRAIDALAALTGNIGLAGGGANYANVRVEHYIDHAYLSGADLLPLHRYYPKPQLASALAELCDPPIAAAYISRANPLVQVGDGVRLSSVLSKIPFVITAEHFMTDTAAASDLVLPCTNFLEEEGLFYNSMSHSYLVYGPAVLQPLAECRSEFSFLKELAVLLGAKGFPDLTPSELLSRVIEPLTIIADITLEDIKRAPFMLPGGDEIPWQDRIFNTADGKYNFYSAAAEKDGGDPLPLYHASSELSDHVLREQGFIYWFVSPHPRESIHSTHRLPDAVFAPLVYLHPLIGEKHSLANGDRARISSIRGFLEAEVVLSEKIRPDTVLVYEGWWHASGAAVNNLTPDRLTDMGFQAALYDCLCRIDKVNR
ncbi:MAG TPA: molybdopterin-dependent oxidoreductase, partial [Candidatus Limnocylindrales bacterium]|nr:molybdopterin-dependent oxidoreductase [Candidatus Limnocylindrales bacterium]